MLIVGWIKFTDLLILLVCVSECVWEWFVFLFGDIWVIRISYTVLGIWIMFNLVMFGNGFNYEVILLRIVFFVLPILLFAFYMLRFKPLTEIAVWIGNLVTASIIFILLASFPRTICTSNQKMELRWFRLVSDCSMQNVKMCINSIINYFYE